MLLVGNSSKPTPGSWQPKPNLGLAQMFPIYQLQKPPPRQCGKVQSWKRALPKAHGLDSLFCSHVQLWLVENVGTGAKLKM